jgi:hypothetical protein
MISCEVRWEFSLAASSTDLGKELLDVVEELQGYRLLVFDPRKMIESIHLRISRNISSFVVSSAKASCRGLMKESSRVGGCNMLLRSIREPIGVAV